MIETLKKLFETPPAETEDARKHRLRLASAALLIETARADFSEDPAEEATLKTLLSETLDLSLIHISEPTRHDSGSRMPSSA